MSSNPIYGEVCSKQHYVLKFVSDLRQVGGFLLVLRFRNSTNKTDSHDVTEILLKVALNIINQSLMYNDMILSPNIFRLTWIGICQYFNVKRLTKWQTPSDSKCSQGFCNIIQRNKQYYFYICRHQQSSSSYLLQTFKYHSITFLYTYYFDKVR